MYCGIDYSLRSPAVAFYKDDGTYNVHFMSMVKRAVNAKAKNLHGTHYVLFETFQERIDKISNWVLDLIIKYEPTAIGIEDYSYNSQGSSVLQIAENTGLLKWKIYNEGLKFRLLAPKEIKKFATKNGNAGKFLMEQHFKKDLGRDIKAELDSQAENPSSDIIDAYYLSKLMWKLCVEKK